MEINQFEKIIIIERNFTTKEVIELFKKLEKQRNDYHPEDACEILSLNKFFKIENLIE